MDILAARKKAAELAKKNAAASAAAPEARPAVPAPPASAVNEQQTEEPLFVPVEIVEEPLPAEEIAAVPDLLQEQGFPSARDAAPEAGARPEEMLSALAEQIVSLPEQAAPEEPPVSDEAPAPPLPPEPAMVEQAADVLAEDAQRAPEELPAASAAELETLAFRIGTEQYAVPVEQVKEVLRIREATPVPHAPDHIRGVISLRGSVLPVIDLSLRLGLGAGGEDEKARIVVVTVDDEDAGLVVDRVLGVVRFPADAVQPVPDTVEHGAELLKGLVRKDGKLYIILELSKAAG